MQESYYFQRIGSVMRDNQYDRTVTGYRTGKLGKKLYKVALDNDKVFDRRVERKNKEYHVVLMIDESGSMEGPQINVASSSAKIMAQALEKNNIKFAIFGFNRYIRVHKTFEEKFSKEDYNKMFVEIISSVDIGGICNHDLLAVNQIEESIRGLDPQRTIAMMFVDGRPECACSVDAANPQRILLDQTKKLANKCKFITFGILTNSVEKYYPNVVVIESLDEFMARSLYALQAIIRRG